MPVTPTYPGVYIEEIPSGVRTITGVAMSITAFVGYTARGPINRAVRLFNFGEYERNFGPLHRESEVSYAVQQFFLNGGSEAYVVRVASGAVPAKLELRNPAGSPVLEVTAASAGVWANLVRLDVDYATANPDSLFNLTATQHEKRGSTLVPVSSESYINLSMNSQAGNFAPDVVNSASKLIRLKMSAAAAALIAAGFSLSKKLNPFPSLTAQQTTLTGITGIVDGSDPFTLEITGPAPTTIAILQTAITAAITTAGLTLRLEVKRAKADGGDDTNGDYLKLASKDTTERAAVRIVPAPTKDLSAVLGFGLSSGGREFEATRDRRPAMNGTTSADLADLLGTTVSGTCNVRIFDPAAGQDHLPSTAITLPAAKTVGPELRNAMQDRMRSINATTDEGKQAIKEATVELVGTRLRFRPSASTPNAQLELTGALADAIRSRTTTGGAGFMNVQQYSLGTGYTAAAQSAAVAGSDGSAPTTAEIIGSYGDKTGIYALRDADLFNILCIPRTAQLDANGAKSVIAAAVSFCEERRAFYLIDPEPKRTSSDIADWAAAVSSSRNAAVFFPQISAADPLADFRLRAMPPSGAMAGVFARTDAQRGVWKAPAGTEAVLQGVQGLDVVLTDQENGTLNPLGVNCLRQFPVYGLIAWGARTRRGADAQADEYKYIPVRRTALFIEETLYRNLKWVVFEPNDEPLWAQIRLNVGAFMQNLFRQGAFAGRTPREAYFVKCDKETTTQNDVNLGIVNIVVGFAPLKPAEFVIIKIQQMAGQIQT